MQLKQDEEGETTTFYPGDIKAFRFIDSKYFVS